MSSDKPAATTAASQETEVTAPLPTVHCPLPTHSIRLGPPWQVTASDNGTRHARKFGRPRTLDANERLWLVCEHVPGPAEIRVNDAVAGTVAAPGPFAADITSVLQTRNEVTILISSDSPLGGIALEVRTA